MPPRRGAAARRPGRPRRAGRLPPRRGRRPGRPDARGAAPRPPLSPGRWCGWPRPDPRTTRRSTARGLGGPPEGSSSAPTASAPAGAARAPRVAAARHALLVSVLLRPEVPPVDAGLLPIVAAVAAQGLGPDARIVWPNDVLIDGRKVAGILCEMSADQERVQWAVAGIGVNVRSAPALDDARWEAARCRTRPRRRAGPTCWWTCWARSAGLRRDGSRRAPGDPGRVRRARRPARPPGGREPRRRGGDGGLRRHRRAPGGGADRSGRAPARRWRGGAGRPGPGG